jgi:hypothetical protein
MGLLTIYKGLIDEIITQLKTISELADGTDLQGETDPRVVKWNSSRSPERGTYEAEVKAGPMDADSFTTKSTDNEFQIIVDLIYWGDEFESGFDNALSVAEKIYDKLHLTTLNEKCRNTVVTLFPGDGELAGDSLLAIPIRIIVTCKRVIHQT